MIIVEGPDGAGKTTLVNRLSADLSLPIAPRRVSKTAQPLVPLKAWVDENLREGLVPTLFDRHALISEFIYGPVLKGNIAEGFDDFWWLRERAARLHKLSPMVIWCLPPLHVVQSNVWGDPDNVVVAGHIETLYWLYYHAAATWPGVGFVYDYTGADEWTHGIPNLTKVCRTWLSQHLSSDLG